MQPPVESHGASLSSASCTAGANFPPSRCQWKFGRFRWTGSTQGDLTKGCERAPRPAHLPGASGRTGCSGTQADSGPVMGPPAQPPAGAGLCEHLECGPRTAILWPTVLPPTAPAARRRPRGLRGGGVALWVGLAVPRVSPRPAQFTHFWPSPCQPAAFGRMGAGPLVPPERLWALRL